MGWFLLNNPFWGTSIYGNPHISMSLDGRFSSWGRLQRHESKGADAQASHPLQVVPTDARHASGLGSNGTTVPVWWKTHGKHPVEWPMSDGKPSLQLFFDTCNRGFVEFIDLHRNMVRLSSIDMSKQKKGKITIFSGSNDSLFMFILQETYANHSGISMVFHKWYASPWSYILTIWVCLKTRG